MLGLGAKKVGEFPAEIILSFPGGFFLDVFTPLDFVELYGTSSSQANIFVQYSNRSLSVGQIMVQVYGEMVNVLENFRPFGNFQTLPKLAPQFGPSYFISFSRGTRH